MEQRNTGHRRKTDSCEHDLIATKVRIAFSSSHVLPLKLSVKASFNLLRLCYK
jgi:hypothetical protein